MLYVDFLNVIFVMKVFFRTGIYWVIIGLFNKKKLIFMGNYILEMWCLLKGGCYNKCYVNIFV